MQVNIRFARVEQDAQRILDIYAPYILKTTVTFECEVPTLGQFQERMRGVMARFPWLVCEVEGRVAGYAYATRQYERAAYDWNAELSVYLAPEYQGLGLGSMLYRALIGLLEKQGYRNVYVRVVAPNEQSVALHRSFGFEQVGLSPATGFKLGRWLDMACLGRQIGPHDADPKPPAPVLELDADEVAALLRACAQTSN